MAYFPNGSAGMAYENWICIHCVHHKPDDGGCAVWLAHLEHNYDKETRAVLDLLIPTEEDGLTPGRCNMFHAANEDRCTETEDMFG